VVNATAAHKEGYIDYILDIDWYISYIALYLVSRETSLPPPQFF
jgi:hypothetical protein